MAANYNDEALYWLPSPPADFTQRCRQLLESSGDSGNKIRALASFDLDENQLNRLANAIGKAREKGNSFAPLTPFRVGIMSNATTDLIVPALVVSAARYGIALECVTSEYGQAVQTALSPESKLHRSRPDAVLVALDYRGYPLASSPGDVAEAEAMLGSSLGQIEALRSGIRMNGNAICIVQTLAPPVETLFGSLDRTIPGTMRWMVNELNAQLAASLEGTKDILFDVAGLAAEVGLANWHSPEQWNMAKLPFSSVYTPLYADRFARIVAALLGKSRRCLVLDLDNTVWGGVIGDDGLEGIQLAQGDATGEAFLSVQRYAIALRARGVVLAVSSKNSDEIARIPFRKHPEMLLREDHIAVFQANWNDKVTNIMAVAKELSLGLESLVFLDDNPAERGIVRQFLPQVAVPELPPDPALYVRTLSATGYFESVVFSSEDQKRADYYQDNARRVTLQNQFADVDSYLDSLKMVITFQAFDETGRARIAQLINKSNQFNLTTKRYTEAGIAALEQDGSCYTLQVRLSDIFGDNGMISVVICRRAEDNAWEFDSWLMSCRVMGRRVEEAVLQQVLNAAKEAGIRKLVGKYIPTDRNQLVEKHYEKLGFTQIAREPDGTTVWQLDLVSARVATPPMEIQSGAPALSM